MEFHPASGAPRPRTSDERVLRNAALAILRARGEQAYEPVESADIEIAGVALRYRVKRFPDEDLDGAVKRKARIELFLNPEGCGERWTWAHSFTYYDYLE